MAEIYRDDATKAAKLSVVGSSAVSAVFVKDGISMPAGAVVTDAVSIPYAITFRDGDFDVVWTYTVGGVVYTRTDKNTVVTPYFTATELSAYDSDLGTLTSDQVIRLERLVRGIINVCTGQSFGMEVGSTVCYGNNDSILTSEKRIVSITSIAEVITPTVVFTNHYRAMEGGYALERVDPVVDQTIKVPAFEETIFDRFANRQDIFINNRAYIVTGVFGWDAVPYDANLAAMHLAGEFSCDESVWRDRYIKSIKPEGFDMDFRSDAFLGTGSVIADQLLGKYVANKLAII